MHNPIRTRPALLLALVPVFSVLLVLHVSASHFTSSCTKATIPQETPLHVQKHMQVAHSTCEGTLYPDLCVSTLASFPDLASKSVPQLICSLLNHSIDEVRSSSHNCTGLKKRLPKLTQLEQRALDDCINLFDDTVSELRTTVADLSQTAIGSKRYHHYQTLLSGAMTNLYTCLDGFDVGKGINVRKRIQDKVFQISHHCSNSLAMLKKVPGVQKPPKSEAFPEYVKMKGGFPSWMSKKDRKLLQAAVNESKINLVVAQDGTGNYKTIGEAVAAAQARAQLAGTYLENVEVSRKKTNLMLVGDGIGKTVVKASRNVVDGWTTFQSATFAVVGDGFIAKGITFENSAGPSKHQAVAVRSGADLSAFYQCSFVGYQDTLYVHSLRQFHRECDIYGTVDFIFGNAAVVFQNCNLYARKPNANQQNTFTAQGREDPNENTGISILNCKVAAAADLVPVKSSFKSYLGRPWKTYSRTVFLKSYMEDLIDPAGWLEWSGTFALSTLYYGEYQNSGPGSSTSGRVKWAGYRVNTSATEAGQLTVGQFIQGNEWLTSTGVPFFSGFS